MIDPTSRRYTNFVERHCKRQQNKVSENTYIGDKWRYKDSERSPVRLEMAVAHWLFWDYLEGSRQILASAILAEKAVVTPDSASYCLNLMHVYEIVKNFRKALLSQLGF